MPASVPWTVEKIRLPEPGESLSGFIARVAAAEGLPNTLELTALASASGSRRPELSRGGNVDTLTELLQVSREVLTDMTYFDDPHRPGRRLFYRASVRREAIVHDERRFSPTTLAKHGIHLAAWQMKAFPFCAESGELLTARCPDPECAKTQRWYNAAGVDLCDGCGEPLNRAENTEVRAEDLDALSQAIGLVHTDSQLRQASRLRLPNELQVLQPGDLLDILTAVAGVHTPGISSRHDICSIGRCVEAGMICTAIANACRTLIGWPNAFEDLVTARLADRPGKAGDGNAGKTMSFLGLETRADVHPACG